MSKSRTANGRGVPRSKININFTTKPIIGELMRPIINRLPLHGMTWGIAYIQSERAAYRCVRWRRFGICKYVLIGRDRGKVVPVMRSFRKIRACTPKEEQKILGWIKRWELFL